MRKTLKKGKGVKSQSNRLRSGEIMPQSYLTPVRSTGPTGHRERDPLKADKSTQSSDKRDKYTVDSCCLFSRV